MLTLIFFQGISLNGSLKTERKLLIHSEFGLALQQLFYLAKKEKEKKNGYSANQLLVLGV
jgi:hypothetical protein